ncbi:MAG: hypothetical protein LBB94_05095 [Clostridiales bacterium]|nr:hypothetical protein [Clostridiales bacterium]
MNPICFIERFGNWFDILRFKHPLIEFPAVYPSGYCVSHIKYITQLTPISGEKRDPFRAAFDKTVHCVVPRFQWCAGCGVGALGIY